MAFQPNRDLYPQAPAATTLLRKAIKMMEAGSGGGGGVSLEFPEEVVPAHQKCPEPAVGDPGTSRRVTAFTNNGFPRPRTGLTEGKALFSSQEIRRRKLHTTFSQIRFVAQCLFNPPIMYILRGWITKEVGRGGQQGREHWERSGQCTGSSLLSQSQDPTQPHPPPALPQQQLLMAGAGQDTFPLPLRLKADTGTWLSLQLTDLNLSLGGGLRVSPFLTLAQRSGARFSQIHPQITSGFHLKRRPGITTLAFLLPSLTILREYGAFCSPSQTPRRSWRQEVPWWR